MPEEERGWLGDSWAFTKSLGSGLWDAGSAAVEGVVELVKGGYALATDEKARESAWKTTKELAKAAGDYGKEVWDDPAKAYREARDGALAAYNRFEQAKEQAAAEGRSAEFWGDLTGKGLFEVGSILIPAGVAAKAGKLGKVASVADDVADVAKGAKQLENAEDIVSASNRVKAVVANPVIEAADDVVSPVKKCPLKDNCANKKKINGSKKGNKTEVGDATNDSSINNKSVPSLSKLASGEMVIDDIPISQATNNVKGNFGEHMADLDAANRGWIKVNDGGNLTEIGEKIKKGIDGVYTNPSPPPGYIIADAKYGTAQLSTLKDGTKQMSDKWIRDRLVDAVGEDVAEDILESGYKRVLQRVDKYGNIVIKELN
jgi:hypothetical protein